MTAGLIADMIGNIGVALYVVLYFLLQAGRIQSSHYTYPFLNMAAACLMLISLSFHPNIPAIIIQVIWILISLYGIWNIRQQRKKNLL